MGQANYSATQRASLKEIALQCPQNGGEAVYQARAMLGMVITEEKDCKLSAERSVNNSSAQNSLINSPKIYPNPTSGSFTVSWNELSTANLIIYSATGKQVYKNHLNKGENAITLDENLKGIFLYRISNEKETFSGKIILQ